jgi:hypothetical protein
MGSLLPRHLRHSIWWGRGVNLLRLLCLFAAIKQLLVSGSWLLVCGATAWAGSIDPSHCIDSSIHYLSKSIDPPPRHTFSQATPITIDFPEGRTDDVTHGQLLHFIPILGDQKDTTHLQPQKKLFDLRR